MKAEDIAKVASECIGMNRDEVRCSGTHAWCANFVSEVLKKVGIDMYDLSCTSMQKRMSESADWDEPDDYPKVGDIIFFDWDHLKEAKPLDHVGVITKFKDRVITYVNGNGSSSWYVTEQTISFDSNCIAYWMRYVGDVGKQPPDMSNTFSITLRTLKRGVKGNDVKALQRLLFADGYSVGTSGDDGDFGKNTEKAVVKYQNNHKLTPDGIAGKDTFTELFKP